MKLTYTTADKNLTVEIEGNNDKELFRKLSHFQEIFEDVPSAKIGDDVFSGGDVRYRIRHVKYTDEKGKEKEADYFEKLVVSGKLKGYKKSYGVLDDGTDNLFPKRDVEGENIVKGFNGWHKYNSQEK
jgi:hypothetical protein